MSMSVSAQAVKCGGGIVSAGPARARAGLTCSSGKFCMGTRLEVASGHGAARRLRASSVPLVTAAVRSFKLNMQGKHLEVTEAIREYAESKVFNAVEHYESGIREVDVRFSARGGDVGNKGAKLQKVEVTAFTKQGVIRAEVSEDNLYASIDKVSDKLARKLRKKKERRSAKSYSHTHHHSPTPEDLNAVAAKSLEELESVKPSLPEEVIRTKYFSLEPLTVDEAIENLQMVGHDFYTFTNANTGELNILYSRNAGGYGLIVPRQPEEAEAA